VSRRLVAAALTWYSKTIRPEPVEVTWSSTLPLLILVLYLASTPLYSQLEDLYPVSVYLGPQTFFFLAILFLHYGRGLGWTSLGLGTTRLRQNLALAAILIALTYLGALALGGVLWLVDSLVPIAPRAVPFFAARPLALDPVFVLCLVVLAPIFEEIIFRALLLPALVRELGTVPGILLDALIFMAAHLVFHPGAFILGLLAAILYRNTASVIPVIALHAACNAAGILLPKYLPFLYSFLRILFQER